MVKNMVTLGYTHIHTYWGMFLLKRAGMGSRSIHFPQAEPGKAMHKYIERERERERESPLNSNQKRSRQKLDYRMSRVSLGRTLLLESCSHWEMLWQGIIRKDIISGELVTLGNVKVN